MSFRIPASFCPHCRAEISAAWREDETIPRPGDWSLCAACGSWMVFDNSLHVRRPDEREQGWIRGSPSAQELHRLWVRFMREKKGAKTQ